MACAALLGALLLTNVLPARYRSLSGFVISLAWEAPSRPRTVLEFPPFGEVEATTHRLPIRLVLRLDRVEPVTLSTLSGAISQEELGRLEHDLVAFMRSSAMRFGLRQLAVAGAGAAVGAALTGAAPAAVAASAGAAAAVTAAIEAVVTRQFRADAFSSPRYRGVLEAAPQLVETARSSIAAISGLSDRLQVSTSQLAEIFRRIEAMPAPSPPDDDMVVAHVSDLHNNPSGFALVDAVVRRFGAVAVIDTGDMLELGTPFEPVMLRRIEELKVPYLFVPGNHDTPRLARLIRQAPNARVLDGEVVNVGGLRVLGVADPGAFDEEPGALDEAGAKDLAGRLAGLAAQGEVDIVAVHNNKAGENVPPGVASAVLSGHSHQEGIAVRDSSVYVNAGSTGAGGLRGLESGRGARFTLALLHFDRASRPIRLWAVDLIAMDAASGELGLERRLVAPERATGTAGQGEATRRVER